MVESLDRSVGRIVAALEKYRLRHRTLVVFTSDNGGYLNYGQKYGNISSNGPLRGQKGSLYEGGHRVPMIMSWPGIIAPGVTEELTHSTDLLPTFLALAGITGDHPHLDGIDLAPLLLRGEKLPQRNLYWRAGAQRAVRSGAWKLCVAENRTELFNLQEDLGEQHNLAAREPELLTELIHAWTAWEIDVNRSAAAQSSGLPPSPRGR
jgi:arylsulfatase A-like enzyme